MGQASPALALGDSTAQTFRFATRQLLKVQVRFFSDAAASNGNEIDDLAGGSRSVTVRPVTSAAGPASEEPRYLQRELLSAMVNGTQVCNGATWYQFGLVDGGGVVEVTASGGADPGGAASYRILVDTETY